MTTMTPSMTDILREAVENGQVIKPPTTLDHGVSGRERDIDRLVDRGLLTRKEGNAYRPTLEGEQAVNELPQPEATQADRQISKDHKQSETGNAHIAASCRLADGLILKVATEDDSYLFQVTEDQLDQLAQDLSALRGESRKVE